MSLLINESFYLDGNDTVRLLGNEQDGAMLIPYNDNSKIIFNEFPK